MIEIERKFLVKSKDYRREFYKKTRITQGFLNTNKNRTVRIRIHGDKAFITVKGKSSKDGSSRFEWEKEIEVKEAKLLMKLCEYQIIDKIRFEVKSANHILEIDEFMGENEGLVIAEVELQGKDDTFLKPNWLGKEITGIKKYYNSKLSKKPYKSWIQ